MKRTFPALVVSGVLLGLLLHAEAAVIPHGQPDLQRHWQDVKSSLKQGAYLDALQTLEVLLTITPDDPWAQLYRTLCETRLRTPSPFTQLSPAQLAALHEQLRQEEGAQRRTTAQNAALERAIRQEQVRWDRELKTLQRQVKAETIEQTQRAQAQERLLAREEAVRRVSADQPEPSAEGPSAPPGETMPPRVPPTTPSTPGLERSVELAPVTVSTATPEKAVPTPSLVGRPKPPPGAVQIDAQQMRVSPERALAIAEGNVEIVFENAILTCDHVTLFTDTKDVYAEGHVRLEEGTQVFRGEMVHYNFETKKGRFLQGTVSSPPWHEHGRSVEHIAEGVYQVTPGYVTSCDQEPPHFKFYGRRAMVFADDKLARARNVALIVERLPFLYLPYLSFADRHMPFYIIPGKKKPWEQFALMGYRYELPVEGNHKGTVKLDWRRAFGWGVGMDHQFDSAQLGKGLLKLYYNEEQNRREPRSALPKGADVNRYRALWRHRWQPLEDTTMITDLQKYSDVNFRRELLFREEFDTDDQFEGFVSSVTNTPDYTLSALAKKRLNRFQSVSDALPQVTLNVREQRIGETMTFSQTTFDIGNFQTKNAHSDNDADVVRVDWFQQLSYALNLFRPILVTPRAGVRQTYYTKDIQGGSERPNGNRDVLSGQFSMGADASLKLFRIFPIVSNVLGMDLHWLRHVLTPTVAYSYVHQPTVPNSLLNFAAASGATNQLSFGIENKLQTRRSEGGAGKLRNVDLARFLLSIPYTFQGNGNKQGGRIGDWSFDLELYPWPWMRLETDWVTPSHFVKGTRDDRIQTWNVDLVLVGGKGELNAEQASDIQAPSREAFIPGPRGALVALLKPQGQWYLGLGQRYSQNAKTESVVQFDWRLTQKWEIGTFHRFTWKEVSGTSKRFNNIREYQYVLRRDLHDWIAELVYRVDREFGEELFLTLTLKAYPNLPVEVGESYHQPKIGSQSSPFSPIRVGTTP